VCLTAVTPTKAGEGKTTTAISLADALGWIGEPAALCLREPSLGPVFGIKGGGTGGGRAQIVPPDLVNLHFTGDIHAIGAANNLLAAMLESHVLHGNELRIEPLSITWRRCLDMDDRALRRIVVGLGGRPNGRPRETGFDITAASEVMAIVAVSQGYDELRRRLGAITVAANDEGEPVTAEQIGAAGSMAALLVDAAGIEPVAAVNHFPRDSRAEIDAVRKLALEHGAFAAEVNDGFWRGGTGAAALAEAVKAATARPTRFRFLYSDVQRHHLDVALIEITAAPLILPARRRSSAAFVSARPNGSTCVCTGTRGAICRNSTPSARVRFATDRTLRSPQRSSYGKEGMSLM
jgi:formyltetrahydrofolate synthetase